MNPQLSARILIALSICFGITVAIVGFLDSSAVGTVALIGSIVIGGLWAIRAIFTSRAGR